MNLQGPCPSTAANIIKQFVVTTATDKINTSAASNKYLPDEGRQHGSRPFALAWAAERERQWSAALDVVMRDKRLAE